MREKLVELLTEYFSIGDSYAYNLTRVKSAFACGTMGLDDFEEFDEETVNDIVDHLLANGVTIQKWIPVSEPPKTHGIYQVAILDEWRHKIWHGSFIKPDNWCVYDVYGNTMPGIVTHWMPLPEAPKEGEG